jgi:hypothetical protein
MEVNQTEKNINLIGGLIVCLIGFGIWTLRHKTNVYSNLALNRGATDDCFIMKSAVRDTVSLRLSQLAS